MAHYVSIDWGRKQDHTAITYVKREGSYPHWTFTVDDAVRYPLGTRFHHVLADLRTRSGPPGWEGANHTLITDASGIGDVLFEDMRQAGLDPIGIIITGGGSASRDGREPKLWKVARNILVDTLKHRLGQSLHLRCSTEMAVEIAKEAANMQYSITSALHEHIEPRQGKHDDLLLSVAMGVWLGAHEGPPAASLDPDTMERIWREAEAAGELAPRQPLLPRRRFGSRGRCW